MSFRDNYSFNNHFFFSLFFTIFILEEKQENLHILPVKITKKPTRNNYFCQHEKKSLFDKLWPNKMTLDGCET